MKIVYITCKNQTESLKIGKILVEKKLAACVNIVPVIKSIYRWKGEIIKDSESVLLVKTNSKKVKELMKKVKSLHSYKIPCIEVINIEHGSGKYIEWINNELK